MPPHIYTRWNDSSNKKESGFWEFVRFTWWDNPRTTKERIIAHCDEKWQRFAQEQKDLWKTRATTNKYRVPCEDEMCKKREKAFELLDYNMLRAEAAYDRHYSEVERDRDGIHDEHQELKGEHWALQKKYKELQQEMEQLQLQLGVRNIACQTDPPEVQKPKAASNKPGLNN